MTELWLIRHGETEWARTGRHTGRTDVALTQKGEEEAKLLRRRLVSHPFVLVLTSPLRRARDTCWLAGYAAEAVVDPDLAEWDYGDDEGRTTAEIRAERPGWSIWNDGPKNGETLEQIGRRAERAIARALLADGDAALFAHGHLLRVLAARWLGLPVREGRLLALDTATLSVLGTEHDERVLRRWNEACHLEGEP